MTYASLSEEMLMLRDSLRRLLDDIAPQEALDAWDKADRLPKELLQKFGELGACAVSIDEEFGGFGKNIPALLMVIEEIGRKNMALGGLYVQCAGYAGMNVSELGSQAQKEKFLPLVAEGKLIFALGLSEPNVGGDLATVSTRAERKGDRIVINGAKRWCTGAEFADYIYALVRSGPPEDRYKNLTFVIIPTNAPGVSITPLEVMGVRGVPTNDVTFDNVEISVDDIMGGEAGWNQGWKMLAGPTLEVEKLSPTALAMGLCEAAVQEAWDYSQQREQFGMKICGHQAVRHLLADVQTRKQTCRLMLSHSADLVQRGEQSAAQTSMTKLYVSETVRNIVIDCQTILGAYGYAKGFNMERYVRDALVLPIFGGSTAIQKNNIANLLGLPKR